MENVDNWNSELEKKRYRYNLNTNSAVLDFGGKCNKNINLY